MPPLPQKPPKKNPGSGPRRTASTVRAQAPVLTHKQFAKIRPQGDYGAYLGFVANRRGVAPASLASAPPVPQARFANLKTRTGGQIQAAGQHPLHGQAGLGHVQASPALGASQTGSRNPRGGRPISFQGTSMTAPMQWTGDWRKDVLQLIDAPVTNANLQAMNDWAAQENTRTSTWWDSSGRSHTGLLNNPLATMWPEIGVGATQHHIQSYANYFVGMKAQAAHIIRFGGGILNVLRSSGGSQALAHAVAADGWGSGNFGPGGVPYQHPFPIAGGL